MTIQFISRRGRALLTWKHIPSNNLSGGTLKKPIFFSKRPWSVLLKYQDNASKSRKNSVFKTGTCLIMIAAVYGLGIPKTADSTILDSCNWEAIECGHYKSKVKAL